MNDFKPTREHGDWVDCFRGLMELPENTTRENGIGFAVALIGIGIMIYAVGNESVHIGAVLAIGVVGGIITSIGAWMT